MKNVSRDRLAKIIRKLRKEHGPGGVKHLRMFGEKDGKLVDVRRPFEKSVVRDMDEWVLLWNDRNGSTRTYVIKEVRGGFIRWIKRGVSALLRLSANLLTRAGRRKR